MARISTYSLDEEVSGGDKWIGSDSGFYNKTKNFTPLKLADYFNSSEKIDLSNSLRFWYQTLDPLEERSIGTISFEEEVGASVPFSSVSSFLLSKKTEGTIYIYDFFNSLIESKILLHKADTINTYAIYEVVGIEEYDENSEFIKVDVLFIRGNGGLLEDKSYLISVVDFALEASLNWGNIEGTLSDQTDLQDALDLKANIEDIPTLTSELTNDSGFITSFTETDPIFQASEASLFVAGDKANLDNQSGVNSGDETTLSIQTKRPLKTVNGESLEGSGNITVGSSITNTSELINDGADGTSTYVETDELGAVAFSNDYNDLNNKPSVATLLREEFVFSGDQTFTLANNYAQLYSVEVQGQGALSTSQYTLVAPNQVTINDTLDAGDYVVIIYSDASAGVVPYYTQAQTDALLSSKLNEDFSSLPTASLPLSGSEELAITQDGETRKVAVSEFGGDLKLIHKNHVSGLSVINNPNFTYKYTYGALIPGGTIQVGDFVDIEVSFEKVSGGTAEVYPRLSINNIDSTAGATVLSYTFFGSSTVYCKIQRSLVVKSSTLTEILHHGTTSAVGWSSANTSGNKNIDWATDKYIIISIANNGSLDATWRMSSIIITKK